MPNVRDAIARGLSPEGDLNDELRELDAVEWEADAADPICELLSRMPLPHIEDQRSPLHAVVGLFQDALTEERQTIARQLRERGLPELIRLFGELRDEGDFTTRSDLMFLLKILAIYRTDASIAVILDALRTGFESDGYLWTMVLSAFDANHPGTPAVFEACRESLPEGFAAVTLLDAANQVFIEGPPEDLLHPFDTPAGLERLEMWLANDDPDEYSYAHSATATLPFISNPPRDRLLALAMDHADGGVQMEAAWASAKLGSESGLKYLARFCLDPNQAATACRYLVELGHEDAIPEEARDADFQALAEMCEWLAHPSEYGRPPDAIRPYDSRLLHWPPTNDERRVWLFEYRYDPDPDEADDEDEPEVGLGMVGSVTFALFGETTAGLPPWDAYALHCCWELQMHEDPRAPEERSIESGRALLAESNEDVNE